MTEPYYEVRNEEVEKLLSDIGRLLKETMPEGYGFALHILNYGEGGGMFYVSSMNREDYVKALREFIQKFEEN
ncbi:MAG TPA: hypothetical protein VII99_10690 [Bacteroidia bacterium]